MDAVLAGQVKLLTTCCSAVATIALCESVLGIISGGITAEVPHSTAKVDSAIRHIDTAPAAACGPFHAIWCLKHVVFNECGLGGQATREHSPASMAQKIHRRGVGQSRLCLKSTQSTGLRP